MQEHKHFFTTGEPGQYPNGDPYLTTLCKKPFSSFSFVIFWKTTMHKNLFIFGGRGILTYWDKKVCSFREACNTSGCMFRFSPSSFILVGWDWTTKNKTEYKHGVSQFGHKFMVLLELPLKMDHIFRPNFINQKLQPSIEKTGTRLTKCCSVKRLLDFSHILTQKLE